MKPWIYTQNPFLNATTGSFIKALRISIYHDSALSANKSDPYILGLYNFYHPLHLAYQSAYNIWKTQIGNQQGQTLNLTQLFDELTTTKIKDWDVKILNQYPHNTPIYTRLLPKRKKSFQSGTQTRKITAVKALSSSLSDVEPLLSVKTDVDAFYSLLNTARDEQKSNLSTTKNMSITLEEARVAICNGQFANYAALLQKYFATPESVELYFDLPTIRRKNQISFKGSVNPNEVHTIVKRTFDDYDQVVLSNTGNTRLKFYLSNMKDMPPDSMFIELDKGKQTVVAEALGQLSHPFLSVYNTDALHKGSFQIKII